jgi:SAM-dependent methyltransferase
VEGTDGVDQPGEGERLSAEAGNAAGKAGGARPESSGADAWGGATYERIAESFAPLHAELVAALRVQPGDRFLDVATGTGGVALPAARAGAEVTGQDLSGDQLRKARATAEAAGLSIRFDECDAQNLPYGDESFDVVASAFGVIFAPDHERAAGELTRVLRHGGRLGLTTWTDDAWFRFNRSIRPDYESATAQKWGDEGYARGLLPELDLVFDRGEWVMEAASAEELWELLAASVPPLKAWLDTLDPGTRGHMDREYLQFLGGGRLRREYIRILGTRR